VPFLLAATIFSFAWNFTFPFQMGVLSLFDRTGAVAVLALIVQLSALSLGPLIASFMVLDGDFTVMLRICALCYLASLVLFLAANRRGSSQGHAA
jgi:hypothetical protein